MRRHTGLQAGWWPFNGFVAKPASCPSLTRKIALFGTSRSPVQTAFCSNRLRVKPQMVSSPILLFYIPYIDYCRTDHISPSGVVYRRVTWWRLGLRSWRRIHWEYCGGFISSSGGFSRRNYIRHKIEREDKGVTGGETDKWITRQKSRPSQRYCAVQEGALWVLSPSLP